VFRKDFSVSEIVTWMNKISSLLLRKQNLGLGLRFSQSIFPETRMIEDSSKPELNGNSLQNGAPQTDGKRPEYPWKKAKKLAAMLSFSGKDYYGMQRNEGFKTIENEFLKALSGSGAIDPDWELNPQKAFFQRASRTDKGVSAAKMICSLKMLQEDDTIPKINALLPPDIRLQGLVKVTKNFNCKSQADARTYLYMTPTFAFSPVTEIVTEQWRSNKDTIDKVNEVLKGFLGSHYFHNFTSGKLPMEPSSQRYILEMEAGQPFEREGLEWTVIKVKGQSFMLHQIRKMIGLTIAIVRGHTSLDTLEVTWGMDRLDVPRAPGLGLMLEEIHYDRYNSRFGSDGVHENLLWEKQKEEVETFKEDFILSDIAKSEVDTKSMLEWLGNLTIHTFEPRHFESESQPRSPLGKALRLLGKDDQDVKEEGEEVLKD